MKLRFSLVSSLIRLLMLITLLSKAQMIISKLGKNCTFSVRKYTRVGTTSTIEMMGLISQLLIVTDFLDQLKALAKLLSSSYMVLKLSQIILIPTLAHHS